MNLYDLIQRVYTATDRNPNTSAYKNQVIGFINDAMLTLCGMGDWLFLHKRGQMTVYPDYTTGTASVVNGQRGVQGNGTSWGDHMDGHLFIGPDGETYTIAHVSATNYLYLSSAYEGVTVNSTYTIRFFAYCMPDDCIEPMSQVSRDDDYGRIRYIDNETEAERYFDRDDTGDPYFYFPAENQQTRTLDATPSAAAGAAGGALTSGTLYGYRLTVRYEGVEGPPTTEVTFTATATGKINLSNIQDLRVPVGGGGFLSTGYRKHVWRREESRPYYYIKELDDYETTYVDDGSVTPSHERPLIEYGTMFKVWFYPRPDSEKDIEVWYKRRPRRLQKDNDVPEIPPEYHDILWRMASIEIIQKSGGDMTALWREVYDERTGRLALMKKAYLVRSDRHFMKSNTWEGMFSSAFTGVNLGTASET